MAATKYTVKPKTTKKIGIVAPKGVTTLIELLEKKIRINFGDVQDYDQRDFPSQCGAQIVYNLNHLSASEQVDVLIGAFFGFDTTLNLKDLKVSQIVISDVVNSKGNPCAENDNWYVTKMVCIKHGNAGPVTVNPTTRNYIRHFTITPDLLVDIYNKNY